MKLQQICTKQDVVKNTEKDIYVGLLQGAENGVG